MLLEELEIYKLSRELSKQVWRAYKDLEWQVKKTMGDQWLSSTDSVGANITEGFGRYHYLDKNKFNYNSRGSLLEVKHWTELLFERGFIREDNYKEICKIVEKLHLKLNNYINSTRNKRK